MTVIEIKSENKELQKQGKPWINIERKAIVDGNDWDTIKEIINEYEEVVFNSFHGGDYKKASDKLWKAINKTEKDWRRDKESDDWEKGFREGANHSFSFLNNEADLSDKFVDKEIKELDSELKNRVKIATGRNKVGSVLNEK